MKVLIYDVETAQKKNIGSICAIGWISLDNDQIIDQGYSLINPKCSFSSVNTSIHGLTAADVKNAPCFADYWESTLAPLMSSHLVVAHGAGFDLSATEQALFAADLPDPGINYLDSLKVLSCLVDSDCYKLTALAHMFDYEYNAHNAGEDVKALLHVLFAVRDRFGFEDLAAMFVRVPVFVENTKTNNYQPKKIVSEDRFASKRHCTEEVEAKSIQFYGLRFCITGDIPGYDRAEVEKIIMEYGGIVTGNVSGKTNYLIVGTYADCAPDYISTKQKKALELIEQGKEIIILNSDQFFQIIQEFESNPDLL